METTASTRTPPVTPQTTTPPTPKPKMNLNLRLVVIILLVIIGITGIYFYYQFINKSASVTPPMPSPEMNSPTDLSTETPPNQADKLSSAYNSFGIEFLKNRVKGEQGKNIFISPASLEMAFSIAMMGAAPSVRAEMVKTLGFESASDSDIKDLSQQFLSQITKPDQDVTISIANSIWTQITAQIKPEFLSVNKEAFMARVQSLDLTTPAGIAVVNQWVSDQTRGKIKAILDNPLLKEQIMVLVNAVYFKGKWTTPFDTKLTADQKFTTENGISLITPFMVQTDSYKYLETNQFQAIQIPYGKGENWAMVIFLPKSDINTYLNFLTPANWSEWLSLFTLRDGTISLPKFKAEYKAKLPEIMRSLGMRSAFETGDQFPGIAPLTYIAEGIHKTFVEVDEEGTEASAVTALLPVAGGGQNPEPPFTMTVNHPFLYAIVDTNTNMAVFLGIMQKP